MRDNPLQSESEDESNCESTELDTKRLVKKLSKLPKQFTRDAVLENFKPLTGRLQFDNVLMI